MVSLVFVVVLSTQMDAAKEKVADFGARGLMTACEAYSLNPASNNQYPTKLAELVRPVFGGASLIRNGAADLLDPWGVAYKYAVAPGENGETFPHVWTERVVGGTTKVIGRKPPDKKQ